MYAGSRDGTLNAAWYDAVLDRAVNVYEKYSELMNVRRTREHIERQKREAEALALLRQQASTAGTAVSSVMDFVSTNLPVIGAAGVVGYFVLRKKRR